jgi:pimeloyl-ACP methyl ester carboxylesterase
MPFATSIDGCRLNWTEKGSGRPVLLIHGFASTLRRNWVGTGWMDALAKARYRAIAYDQRGHGESDKRYDPADYAVEKLVADAIAVLEAARAPRAVAMGYSMGARVALEVAIVHPERVDALVLSGIGGNFRDTRFRDKDREVVARALEADDPSDFPPWALTYRKFADQNHADRRALAACWRRAVRPPTEAELESIRAPTLIVVGDRDPVAGDPEPLARAIPGAEVVRLAGKDHMNAVGAKEHRIAVLAFLERLGKASD